MLTVLPHFPRCELPKRRQVVDLNTGLFFVHVSAKLCNLNGHCCCTRYHLEPLNVD